MLCSEEVGGVRDPSDYFLERGFGVRCLSLLRVVGEEIFATGQDPCQEKCHSSLAGVAFVDSLLGMVDPFGKLAESKFCSLFLCM